MPSRVLKAFLTVVFVAATFFVVFPLLSVIPKPNEWLRVDLDVQLNIPLNSTGSPRLFRTTIRTANGSYRPVYLINEPNICSAGSNSTSNETAPPLAIIYIHTKPSHFHRRAFIRQTWANSCFRNRFNYSTVFVLGDPQNSTIQQKLHNESQIFHDIVQADFHDVYENLTLKEITALHWTVSHCSTVTFVVKADDDLVIKPWLLHDLFLKYLTVPLKPSIYCRKWDKYVPARSKDSKWYVPLSVYPDKYGPAFCSGPSRIMTKEAVPLLYEGTQKLPFFWLEDVFVTGIVAEHMGVSRHNEPLYLDEVSNGRNGIGFNNLKTVVVHSYGLMNQRKLWKIVVQKFPEYFTGNHSNNFSNDDLLDDNE